MLSKTDLVVMDDRKLALERELSPLHLAFARELIIGSSMADAYRVSHRQPDADPNRGSQLFGRNAKVQEYYALCTGLAADSAIITRTAIISRLVEIGHDNRDKTQSAAVAALKTLLSQLDYEPPTRIEISGPKGGPIESETRAKGLQESTVVDLAAALFGVPVDKARAMFHKGQKSVAGAENTD
jgi:hypothetical protein